MRLPSQQTAAEHRSERSLLPLSWTKIKLLRQCPLALRRRYIDHAVELSSAPAETGIGFHDLAEHDTGDEDALLSMLTRKAALMEEATARDLRGIVRRLVERGGLPGFPADATDVARELSLAVAADGQIVEWDDPRALFRGRLDQSFRENGGELGVVRDWKTNRVVEDPTDQGRYYSWLLAVLFPAVEEVVAEFYFVRFGNSPRRAIYDAAELRATVPGELAAIAEDVERRAREDDWRPRVSDDCRFCSFVSSCPKFTGRISPFLPIESAEQAQAAAEQLQIVAGQKLQLEKSLKAWVRMNGPIDCGDETLDFVRRPTVSVPEALEAFRWFKERGIAGDALWAHLTLRATELRKLLTIAVADQPRRERAAAKEALLAELQQAGLVEESVGSTFRRKGKKVEAESDEEEAERQD